MLTIKQKTDVSHGFSAGNFASAYQGGFLIQAINRIGEDAPKTTEYVMAFCVGFYASHEPREVPACDRRLWEVATESEAGRACVAAGYVDR